MEGTKADTGRDELELFLKEHQLDINTYKVIPDDRPTIQAQLMELCDTQDVQVVLTIGGTGVRPTDWTPEATREVIDKEIPGIAEAMRFDSMKKVRTAMLSRGTAGIRGETLIVNLPGSVRGARENLSVLLPILDHTLGKISKEIHPSG